METLLKDIKSFVDDKGRMPRRHGTTPSEQNICARIMHFLSASEGHVLREKLSEEMAAEYSGLVFKYPAIQEAYEFVQKYHRYPDSRNSPLYPRETKIAVALKRLDAQVARERAQRKADGDLARELEKFDKITADLVAVSEPDILVVEPEPAPPVVVREPTPPPEFVEDVDDIDLIRPPEPVVDPAQERFREIIAEMERMEKFQARKRAELQIPRIPPAEYDDDDEFDNEVIHIPN